MNDTRFDVSTISAATGANRRRVLSVLTALAISGAGALTLTREAAADKRRRCIERCNEHRGGGDTDRERRKRCRRRCNDR